MKKLKHITEICKEIYERSGMSAVIEHVDREVDKNNPAYSEVTYKVCTACDSETPHWEKECLVCGNIGNSSKVLDTEVKVSWSGHDVLSQAIDMGVNLSDDEILEVLDLMERKHDVTIGINWDVIGAWIDYVVSMRGK